jgi:HEAT repeat protein
MPLSRYCKELHRTVLVALVRLGAPSTRAAVELLADRPRELVDWHRARTQAMAHRWQPPLGLLPPESHRATAASVIGAVGRPEAAETLMRALQASPPPYPKPSNT